MTISNILSNGEVNPGKRELGRTEIIFWRELDNYVTNFTRNTQTPHEYLPYEFLEDYSAKSRGRDLRRGVML